MIPENTSGWKKRIQYSSRRTYIPLGCHRLCVWHTYYQARDHIHADGRKDEGVYPGFRKTKSCIRTLPLVGSFAEYFKEVKLA